MSERSQKVLLFYLAWELHIPASGAHESVVSAGYPSTEPRSSRWSTVPNLDDRDPIQHLDPILDTCEERPDVVLSMVG